MNLEPSPESAPVGVAAGPAGAVAPTVEPPPTTSRAGAVAPRSAHTIGVIYGLMAYGAWGIVPIYFRWMKLAHVSPLELLAHRIVWSVLLLAALLRLRGQGGQWLALWRSRRAVLTLSATTVFIAVNWGVFIYTIESEQLLQASLGYFINPLLSVLLGMIFLGERLRGWQPLSVLLAFAGVSTLAIGTGTIPTFALILAFSFGMYGLLRKLAPVEPIAGLLLETLLLAPIAIAYLAWQASSGDMRFLHTGWSIDLGLLSAGVITTLPLIWFTNAARRLPLATLGFMQYLAPSGQFLLAVLAFGESFGPVQALSFGLIWGGLAVFTLNALHRRRLSRSSVGS